MAAERRNTMLSRFLKAQRAALSPRDVGLPEHGRRRTPGLRREEVAMLAGVSVSWYTSLEQGRDISVSTSILEQLSGALQLSSAQREFLFALVHRRPPPLTPAAPQPFSDASRLVWRTLEAMTVPALAMSYRWDVVAWNALSLSFRDYTKLAPRERNLLRILVRDPAYGPYPAEYDEKIRLAVSRLRVDYCQAGNDPTLDELIEELCGTCPIFKRYWHESNSLGPAEASNTLRHPELGIFNFEHSVYVPKGEPHLRVVVFMPRDDETAAKLVQLTKLVRRDRPRAWDAPRAVMSASSPQSV
jgi:transcriptional regulator with XRE-family HTH domain